MKLMFASDIHGSAFYCEKMVDRYSQENPDKLILLGDILYHGPRNDLPKDYAPKKVIEMLNPLKDKIICLRGNCDSEVDQMVLDFPITPDFSTLLYNDKVLYITHGHKLGNGQDFPKGEKNIVIAGHTHIPVFEKRENYYYLNPGSISIPKENSQHSYVIIENNQIIFKNLDGEVYNTYNI